MRASEWWGAALLGVAAIVFIVSTDVSGQPRDPNEYETRIAGAYQCGMLDALQETKRRGRACDEYKAIAKKRGVNVPP